MFDDFDFSVLDDPNYKEDAVREDLIAPLLRALGYGPSGTQRMQRSQALVHPFVMIGSQKRKIHIIPDYTLWHGDQAVLVLDAKGPSEPVVKSEHVEQAFSYAIHPDVRTKSYALCNGRELVLYDIDRSEPVFRVPMTRLREHWLDVLKHFSPDALLDHHHRSFLADLGIFLKNAGFTRDQDITFPNSKISSLGRTLGGGVTATSAYEMVEGIGFQGSFDMPAEVLPVLLSCLPAPAAGMVTKALAMPGAAVWIGGVIEMCWTVRLGVEEVGLYKHDPLIPLVVTAIRGVSLGEPTAPLKDIPPDVLNLPSVLAYL
ncbi:MAG: type I restriction enzyme HsdR N-terminal domain-containing protein [Minicystis sp.]